MTPDRRHAHWDAGERRGARSLQPASIVTVSLPAALRKSLPPHILDPRAHARHIAMSEVAALPLIGFAAPQLILSPLIAPGFDAVDLLTALCDADFSGRYLVLAPCMPDIPLIRSEMLAMAQRLDVDVIAVNGGRSLYQV